MRILLVEDNTVIGAGLAEYLRHAGHVVEWCMDAPCALKKADVIAFDAMVLDLILPGDNSLVVLQQLKLPTVVFTAAAEEDLARVPAGVKVVRKPAEAAEVLRALEALVAEKKTC